MTAMIHPRVSVSQVSSWNWTLDEDLEFYEKAGITSVGLFLPKLQDSGLKPAKLAERLSAAGLRITSLHAPGPFRLDQPEAWDQQRYDMGEIIDIALALRPEVLVFTTGSAGILPWERAADSFEEVMRGTVAEAEREGLKLAVEHTHSLRTDIGFLHTLRDTIELGWRVGTGVCLEVNACWAERNLAGTIGAAVDSISIVQVSDFEIGTKSTPDRLVPGDGDLPLQRIMGQLIDAGYEGMFDIEIVGPRIEAEGYESAIQRSVDAVSEIIEELLRPPPSADDEDEDEEGDAGEAEHESSTP